MSFINMLENDLWTDAEIANKADDLIHETFPIIQETILNRKVLGSQLGEWTLTEEDLAEQDRYRKVCEDAALMSDEAKADNLLLRRILEVEPSYQLVKSPPISPIIENDIVINQEQITQDVHNKILAQDIVDLISPEELYWIQLRNPQLSSG